MISETWIALSYIGVGGAFIYFAKTRGQREGRKAWFWESIPFFITALLYFWVYFYNIPLTDRVLPLRSSFLLQNISLTSLLLALGYRDGHHR